MKLYKLPKHYFIHGNYMKASICDNLVEYFDNNPDRHTTGEVYGTCEEHKHDLIKDPNTKESTDITFYPHNHDDIEILWDYMKELNLSIAEYEKRFERANHMEQYGITERINLQKYEPTEGFKAWHCERAGIAHMSRCLVFMTYLNDVPDGGTEFLYQDVITPAKKGLTLIWPSDWTHTHKGEISEYHKKYIITGWFNYLG